MADLRVALADRVMRVAPSGSSLLDPYVAAAAAAADRAEGAAGDQPDPAMLVPSSYYLIEGERMPLYRAGLSQYRERSVYDFAAVSDRGVTWSDGRAVTLDPASARGGGSIAAMRRNADAAESWRRPVLFVVSPAAGAGDIVRHLAIGDSLTWRGWVTQLKQMLIADGATYQPVGTLNDIAGTLSEGRSSWSPQTYTGVRPGVNADGTPVIKPVTDVAAYLALPPGPYATGDRWDYNPFWRSATPGDPAAIVHGGYVFDVRFYLDRFGLPDPNIVTIALGTNPTLRGWPREETMASIAEMVASVRAAVPTAGIALCLNSLVDPAAWAEISALIADVLTIYSGREADGIAVLPWWQASDPKLGYDVNALSTPSPVGVFRTGSGDGVHPIDQGVAHRQWARMVRGWIASRL